MKTSKKLVPLIALILSLVCFLTACGGDAGKIVQTKTERIYFEEGEKSDPPPELDELKSLLETLPQAVPFTSESGEFVYKIVYPESSSDSFESAVKEFKSNMNSGLRCSPTAVLDSNKDSGYEILVGQTNRKESSDAAKKVKSNRANSYEDFIIQVKGKKIVITGVSESGTIKGMEWFVETFCESTTTWGFVREGYEFLYAPKYNLPAINLSGKSIADYSIVYPKDMEYVYGRAIDDLDQYLIEEFYIELERDDERYMNVTNEILIGNVNRSESKSVTPAENEYIIKQVGKKLVIKASDSVALYYGITAFNDMIAKAKKDNKKLDLADGFELKKTIDKTNPDVYKLTLADEFDTETLNADLWSTYTNATGTSSLGGQYLQKGTEIAYVKDGSLHMPSYVKGNDFWVSELSTKNSYWYKYGCLEVRAKMPAYPAVATIWINADYYGANAEIDILENFGNLKGFSANIHKWFRQPTWDGTTNWAHSSLDGSEFTDIKRFRYNTEKYKDTLADDYHIYSLDWTEDYYRFAVDGVTFFTYDFSNNPEEIDCFRQKLYLIMGCGVGNTSYGPKYDPAVDGTEFDYAVDYVRLYQIPSRDELVYGFKG